MANSRVYLKNGNVLQVPLSVNTIINNNSLDDYFFAREEIAAIVPIIQGSVVKPVRPEELARIRAAEESNKDPVTRWKEKQDEVSGVS